MKWIKTRKAFLNEAKIRQVIHPKQAKQVERQWGEKFLDYEEIPATEDIIQGKWKLSEEDKNIALGYFFKCTMRNVFNTFENLPDKFCFILAQSVNTSILQNKEKYERVLKDFNPKEPTIDQIVAVYDNIFRKLNVAETVGDSQLQKDENGRPVRDEKGEMIKIPKEKGSPVFTNNFVNISAFGEDYNRCFPDEKVDVRSLVNDDIQQLRNIAKEDCNSALKTDFEIFNRDLYLSISHNPKDILNMSISKFYNSCQNLYDGGYRTQLLGNVFDPNSIPAFLTFDTPIYSDEEKISDQLPLSRMIIRNIEDFDSDKKEKRIFFDRAYPDRMKRIFDELVPKYSGNKRTVDESDVTTYIFSPDVSPDDQLPTPYMDRLGLSQKPYIGINCTKLYLNNSHDWSNVRISKNAKLKELIIETDIIPDNFSELKLELDWIKFKGLSLNSLEPFSTLTTDSLAFDKCKFSGEILKPLSESVKKLQIISSRVSNLNFADFKNLQELHLIMTLSSLEELKKSLIGTRLKKLVVSSDITSSPEGKEFIKSLRQSGISVEIKGLKL